MLNQGFSVKDYLYNGSELSIKNDGIRIKGRKITLLYKDISSINIRKARVTRGWLGLIFLGIVLNLICLGLLYLLLVNFFTMSDVHGGHFHYARRSSGIIIGILIMSPVLISIWIKKYFKREVMMIIKSDHQEFRIKFSELNLSVQEVKRYLEERVKVVSVSEELSSR
jgi:hypothetical protein